MNKKIISTALTSAMILSILSGCGATTSVKPEKPTETTNTEISETQNPGTSELPEIETPIKNPEDILIEKPTKETEIDINSEVKNLAFNEFENEVINYLHKDKENYMLSTLSFRYAMALASAGANGETQKELLSAMGFSSMDEYMEWTENINELTDNFSDALNEDIQDAKEYGYPGMPMPERALEIANSIWHNTDKSGTIKQDYINYIREYFNATADNVPQSELVATVNNWAEEKTKGLISSLLPDSAAEANTILVNTLYMKSPWLSQFEEYNTKEDEFTTIDGEKTNKEFMNKQDNFAFYEDKDSKLIVLPMEGGIDMIVVLGNNENISDKLQKVNYEEVILKLPKFEVETSFDQKELINYLKHKGVDLALRKDGTADFSTIIEDAEISIDDIIQKTKIKVDENGTEAAAATAIIMTDGMMMPTEKPKPKEFVADKPFTYYIVASNGENSELLFYGQYVK